MATFHMVFDLNEFVGIDIDYLTGFWYWEGKASALTFIFLAGVRSGFGKNTVKRGIKILLYVAQLILLPISLIMYEGSEECKLRRR
ncbi:MAG: hypothetical protein VR72_21100 [Clostridiaceae bacterium BRH_c20a]|nr:MAG: hypothetical protein VR72_21100 [Clostridiaceae bacterium BRH_c20a]